MSAYKRERGDGEKLDCLETVNNFMYRIGCVKGNYS